MYATKESKLTLKNNNILVSVNKRKGIDHQ